jgi:hypothetical protein
MPALHYKEALAAWRHPRPANDNSLITADSFNSLEERRAFVRREQRDPELVLNLPQLERLSRAAPDAVRLWKYWRDLQCETDTGVFANDNVNDDGGDDAQGESVEPSVEQDLETRPSVNELRRAWESAPARRVSVYCTVREGQRSDIQPVIDPVVCRKGDTTIIGPLEFRNGELIRWGSTLRGKPLRPVERLRAGKGSRNASPDADLGHLVRTSAPMARVVEFQAGVTHSTGKSGPPLECFAEREQSRKSLERGLRGALGAHSEILDLAIGDATAREIGESRGYIGKTAERRGVFLINEAFAAPRAMVGENSLKKAA